MYIILYIIKVSVSTLTKIWYNFKLTNPMKDSFIYS